MRSTLSSKRGEVRMFNAFERYPDCYRRLRKSVRINKLESRLTAANCALGAAAEAAELFVPGRLR